MFHWVAQIMNPNCTEIVYLLKRIIFNNLHVINQLFKKIKIGTYYILIASEIVLQRC